MMSTSLTTVGPKSIRLTQPTPRRLGPVILFVAADTLLLLLRSPIEFSVALIVGGLVILGYAMEGRSSSARNFGRAPAREARIIGTEKNAPTHHAATIPQETKDLGDKLEAPLGGGKRFKEAKAGTKS